jgi:ribonuclease P protein subunit RPR2
MWISCNITPLLGGVCDNPYHHTALHGASIRQGDVFERMNYLYLAALGSSSTSSKVSSYYVYLMRRVGARSVVRLGSDLKRTMCKRCNSLLIHGETCSVRIRGHKAPHTIIKCNHCSFIKRIPFTPRSKKLVKQS